MNDSLNPVFFLPSLLRHSKACKGIQDYQNTRLRRLVAHAYNRVPYYRRLFDCWGIKPEIVRTAADLSAIPVTVGADRSFSRRGARYIAPAR